VGGNVQLTKDKTKVDIVIDRIARTGKEPCIRTREKLGVKPK
jgi:hypothetical protein